MTRDEVLGILRRCESSYSLLAQDRKAFEWAIDFIEANPEANQTKEQWGGTSSASCMLQFGGVAKELNRLAHRLDALESFKTEAGPMLGVGSGTVADRLGALEQSRRDAISWMTSLGKTVGELRRFVSTLASAASKLEG